MIKKISQSFIKDAIDYFSGDLCGNIVREKWVNARLLELDSDAVDLGCYFEYQFTLLATGKGSLPKNGKVPEKKMYANGSKPLAPYALADANAVHLRDYFVRMGLKIIKAGVRLTKGRFGGTIDLVVQATTTIDGLWNEGDTFVIDLKYSGLLWNRWERLGWGAMLFPGQNSQKDYHGIQAKQYHYVSDMPFFFLVVSSTNENDIEMFRVPVDEEMVTDHIKGGNDLFEKFEFESKIGFEARPSISGCNKCPLNSECRDKHTFPHPKTVNLKS